VWGVDVFNYGHVVPKLTFKSDEDVNDFVWSDQSNTLGFVGTDSNESVRTTNYKDYVITHTITNDKMEYRSSDNDLGLDLRGNPYEAKYEYDIKTEVSKDGEVIKTWTNNNQTTMIRQGKLSEIGQPFRGYIFHLENEAAEWIRKDIKANIKTCAEQNKIENEDETCGNCLDGFMMNEEGECISCESLNQLDGVGGRCGNCLEGYIVDEDSNSPTYGFCIEEEPTDNTLLYVGGGLVGLAVLGTLLSK